MFRVFGGLHRRISEKHSSFLREFIGGGAAV